MVCRIFVSDQGLNLGLRHCRQTLYPLSHQGSSSIPETCSLSPTKTLFPVTITPPPQPLVTCILFSVSMSLPKFMSIELVILSNHLILCHLRLFLPSIFPSIRVFSNELAVCIRRPNYWNFSLSVSPSNEYPGLISFRVD